MNKKLMNGLILGCLVVAIGVVMFLKMMDRDGFGADTIAVVNGVTVTAEYYQAEYDNLSENLQKMFKNDRIGFLDELLIKELLHQEALRRQITLSEEESQANNLKETYIGKLIEQIYQQVEISEQEKKDFYAANLDQMNGLAFQDVEASIGDYLAQQKYSAEMDNLIKELRDTATITKNPKWLEANKPVDPVAEVLKNGKPTVLDLGSTTCIPCQMMQPILEELSKEYDGKANILVVDVYEYRHVATQYAVRGIPTQIFFDAKGEQVWRHEGFLAKEEIVKRLEEMGVQNDA